MHKGSCLCGTVKYVVRGKFGAAIYCHCSLCRKATASAFATNAPVAAGDFVVIEGESALKAFDSSPGVHRLFLAKNPLDHLLLQRQQPLTIRLQSSRLHSSCPSFTYVTTRAA